MKKIDLTEHCDQDLSLMVFNDETLYNIRHDSTLFEVLTERFIFTTEQVAVLVQDLNDDLLQEA